MSPRPFEGTMSPRPPIEHMKCAGSQQERVLHTAAATGITRRLMACRACMRHERARRGGQAFKPVAVPPSMPAGAGNAW